MNAYNSNSLAMNQLFCPQFFTGIKILQVNTGCSYRVGVVGTTKWWTNPPSKLHKLVPFLAYKAVNLMVNFTSQSCGDLQQAVSLSKEHRVI